MMNTLLPQVPVIRDIELNFNYYIDNLLKDQLELRQGMKKATLFGAALINIFLVDT